MGISRLIRKEAHFADIDQWNEFIYSFSRLIPGNHHWW